MNRTAASVNARPLSGEMMTAARPVSAGATLRPDDFTDVDYVEVALSTGDARSPGKPKPDAPAMSVLLRKGDKIDAGRADPGGVLFWSVGAAAILLAFWISGGHVLVRETMAAGAENVEPHMRVASVRSRANLVEGVQALLVEGEVVNEGGGAGLMPSLTIAVQANSGDARSYRLTTPGVSIAPGERQRFSSRLDTPADGVKTVSVTLHP